MARKKGPLDAVQFTRESAERIASVVRTAELTPPEASPLTFERLADGRIPKQVRAATFSGAWPIGSSKAVTFTSGAASTANVQNISWPITSSGYANEPCLVGRDGTAWYLIVPRLQTATAVFATSTQRGTTVTSVQQKSVCVGPLVPITFVSSTASATALSGVEVAATLNTTDCSITVETTQTTVSLTVAGGLSTEYVPYGVENIAVVTGTATAVVIATTATASYLRIRVP